MFSPYQIELISKEDRHSMLAEILSTGEEIRTGATIDSNAAYIARKLEEAGIQVTRHNGVGDDLTTLAAVLREIAGRADVAVITGGLGPTADDLTAEAAARAAEVERVLDRGALASIEHFFSKRNRPMNSSNRKQALLPKGARCLANPVGTAPGFYLAIGKCTCFFMPGVPAEMKSMLTGEVLPLIDALRGGSPEHTLTRTITTFGLTESATGEKLAGFRTQFPEIRLGYRVQFPEIHIKFYLRGQDHSALQEQAARAAGWVSAKLGRKVLSLEGLSMDRVVAGLLIQKQSTLALAESCTGGLIAHLLTNVPGSSNYFLFSAVTYANQAKMDVLGVSPETLNQFGAVHEETAREMAAGARRRAHATYGLATSGIAGPDGGTAEKPVGTVCIALATPGRVFARRLYYNFADRLRHKRVFAVAALDVLRRELLAAP